MKYQKPHFLMMPSLSALDSFLHSSLADNLDDLHRARILVLFIWFIIAATLLAILALIVSPIGEISRVIGIPISSIVVVSLSLQLRRLKVKGAYERCSNATVVTMLLVFAVATLISGGITASVLAQLLVIPPLMAFYFVGVRGGITTLIATSAFVIFMILLESDNVSFPSLVDPELIAVLQSIALLVEFICVTALVYVYEFTSESLRIERDIEQQKVLQLAQTDQLTGLFNRRAFDDAMNERVAHHGAAPLRPFVLCYLDLDGFKPINDCHGHEVGDQVLRAVSIRLRSTLQGTDLIGRHGGDEFMLLLDGITDASAIETMAKRFLQLIAEPIETSAGLVSVGGSFGFAMYPAHATDTEKLKQFADSVMYEAKRNRRCWKIFEPEESKHSEP